MIEEGRWDDMLNVLLIHKGDFFPNRLRHRSRYQDRQC